MPINGKCPLIHQVEINLYGSASISNAGDGPFSNGYEAILQSYYADSSASTVGGIEIIISSSTTGGYVSVTTPGGSYYNTHGSFSSKNVSVIINTVKLYVLGSFSGVRQIVSSADVYEDGVLVDTHSGWDVYNYRRGADAFPVFAIIQLSGACSATGIDGYGIAGSFDSDAITEATIGGGIRWKRTSTSSWETTDIYTPSSITSVPLSTTTFGDHISARHRIRRARLGTSPSYTEESNDEDKNGTLWIFPAWDRSIERINDDFACLVRRLAFPGAIIRNQTTTGILPPVVTNVDTAGQTAVANSVGLLELSPGSFESIFSTNPICPAHYGEFVEEGSDFGGADYDPVATIPTSRVDKSTQYPYSCDTLTHYLNHTEPILRLLNTWCNPHWCYLLETSNWEVDGSPIVYADGWEKWGSQWLNASGVTNNTRNHLISEPLTNNQTNSFMDSFVQGKRFLGISGFDVERVAPRTSYTYDSGSSTLWSGEDCTLSFGSTINVNPDELVVTVKLRLGDFLSACGMWAHLADTFLLDWVTTNVVNIKCYLEGVEGSRVLLNDNDPGVSKVRPSGDATKYAGSYAQDYGAGVVTDVGADDKVEGISAATMADPERAHAFLLLKDRTAKFLVFEITVADVDVDVTLEYPQLSYTKSSTRMLTYETAHQGNVVMSDGPGIRFGSWDTGTSGTIDMPPNVYDGATRPNSIDWKIWRNLVLLGVAYDYNLTTELATIRDTFEGQSIGNERNNSYGLLLPSEDSEWPLAIVSSLAEIPPLAYMPRGDRNSDWEVVDGFRLAVWVWAQEPDYFVNPVDEIHLFFDATQWTSATTGIAGWAKTQHTHEVDNTETNAKIVIDSENFATVRPFRGHYTVITSDEESFVEGPDNVSTPFGMFFMVRKNSGGITCSSKFFCQGSVYNQVVYVIEDPDTSHPVIAYDYSLARLNVLYEYADNVELRYSDDYGTTWSSAEVILTTAYFPEILSHIDGWEYRAAFRYDSGTSGPGKIYISMKSPGDTDFSSEIPITNSSSGDYSFEPGKFGLTKLFNGTNSLVLSVVLEGSVNVTDLVSYDEGITWSVL